MEAMGKTDSDCSNHSAFIFAAAGSLQTTKVKPFSQVQLNDLEI